MNIKYRIHGISIDNFIFQKELYSKGEGFALGHNFAFALNKEQCLLKCFYTENMFQNDKLFLVAKLTVCLEIKQDSFEQLVDKGVITIPANFLVQCASLAYGTMRGVVVDRTNDEGVDDIIMPAKYLQEDITKPMVIKLEDTIEKNG